MKTTNLQAGHATDIARGRANPHRATARGITTRDAVTDVEPVTDILFIGATVTDGDDGTAVVTIGGGTGGSPGTDFVPSDGGGGSVVYSNTAAGSSLSLTLSDYTVFDITLTADLTLTFTSPPTDGLAHEWIFVFRQDSVGGWTVTWPGTVAWQDTDGTSGASAPTLYTVPTAEDVFRITTLDNGASYGGGQERSGASAGRWELAVIPGAPPDSLYADGDWLYIFVP